MPMTYAYTAVPDSAIPRASSPVFQHLLDTYASHRALSSERRARLRDDLALAIDSDRDGTVTRPYEAVLVLAAATG